MKIPIVMVGNKCRFFCKGRSLLFPRDRVCCPLTQMGGDVMNIRFLGIVGMVVVAALLRMVPHPPNFAPIAAMALFAGATFDRKWFAYLIPLAAMFMSD